MNSDQEKSSKRSYAEASWAALELQPELHRLGNLRIVGGLIDVLTILGSALPYFVSEGMVRRQLNEAKSAAELLSRKPQRTE